MKILALDSTPKIATAALCEDDRVLAECSVDNGLTHSELLLPMVETLLAQTATEVGDIGLFACTVGPGSFTGVRIGVAVIKGLAFGRGIPCVGVSTPEALAENLAPLPGLYCPVMDARRGQVYTALFRHTGDGLSRLMPDTACSLEELLGDLRRLHADEEIRFCGDGTPLLAGADLSGLRVMAVPPLLLSQNAASVARVALRAYQNGQYTDDRSLTPVYLRLPQAERERLERLASNNSN